MLRSDSVARNPTAMKVDHYLSGVKLLHHPIAERSTMATLDDGQRGASLPSFLQMYCLTDLLISLRPL